MADDTRTITVLSVQSGRKCSVPDKAFDLSQIEPAAVVEWAFETRDEDTLSLIQTGDGIQDFNLRRDAAGGYNPTAYSIAYNLSYARVHLTGYAKGGERVTEPSAAQIDSIPLPVLTAYVSRAQAGVLLDDVKKKPSSDTTSA